MFTLTAHCTIITARNDCFVCYLKQDPLRVSYTLATVSRNSVT